MWFGVKFYFDPKSLMCNLKVVLFKFPFKRYIFSRVQKKWIANNLPSKANWRSLLHLKTIQVFFLFLQRKRKTGECWMVWCITLEIYDWGNLNPYSTTKIQKSWAIFRTALYLVFKSQKSKILFSSSNLQSYRRRKSVHVNILRKKKSQYLESVNCFPPEMKKAL